MLVSWFLFYIGLRVEGWNRKMEDLSYFAIDSHVTIRYLASLVFQLCQVVLHL